MPKRLHHCSEENIAHNFIAAMARSVSQVTIVTTDGRAGRFGVTVSAFSSVSAEPPLVLVCINRRSPVVEALNMNGCFSVNLLHETQNLIADCFAGRTGKQAAFDFSCAEWTVAKTGAPLLVGAGANFDCILEDAYDAGTHRICVGRVRQVVRSEHAPLAFCNRGYAKLTDNFHYQEQRKTS